MTTIGLLVLASLALAFFLHRDGLDCLAASKATGPNAGGHSAGNGTIKPYWHRPGCHQVAHTRTISIPGCVKFDLSTNACRGFCMSFSIPVAEDIGPPGRDRLDEGPSQTEPARSPNQQQLMSLLRKNSQFAEEDERQHLQAQLMQMIIGDTAARKTGMVNEPTAATLLGKLGGGGGIGPIDLGNAKELVKLNTFLHLSGQTRSPLAGTIGDTGERRDVISVGQCCNMMETEDVTVNLRCGLNETRRLVFKSAKTCECFFCKHV